ncbi:hypothetical protein B0H65DRAFT_591705, partial [Neurospora tetraspora]
ISSTSNNCHHQLLQDYPTNTRVNKNSRVLPFASVYILPFYAAAASVTLRQTGRLTSTGKHAPCSVLPCLPRTHPDQPIQALASDAALNFDQLNSLEQTVSLTSSSSPPDNKARPRIRSLIAPRF